MIRMRKEQYQAFLEHAVRVLPDEACALLGGTIQGSDKIIEKVYIVKNIDASNEHFSMDPREQLTAVREMRKSGYVQIGNIHSHPETPSRPSEEDKRLAYDSQASYLILSLADLQNPVVKAFRIQEQTEVTLEELELFTEI
ncbi:MAG: M67 family metallopeptidase [Lachnospiraceae bacterium]